MFGQAFLVGRRSSGVFASVLYTAFAGLACVAFFQLTAVSPAFAQAPRESAPKFPGADEKASSEEQKRANATAAQYEEFHVRVVNKDGSKDGVAGAEVSWLRGDNRQASNVDANGELTETRLKTQAIFVYAESKDEKFVGAAVLKVGQRDLTIALQSPSTLKGRLVEEKSGTSVPGVRLELEFKDDKDGATISGGAVRETLPDGSFNFVGLAPSDNYRLCLPVGEGANLVLSEVKLAPGKQIDLGKVEISAQKIADAKVAARVAAAKTKSDDATRSTEWADLNISVVGVDGKSGVAGAKVSSSWKGDKEVTTDANGKATTRRRARPLAYRAQSADGKLLGITTVKADQKEATLVLKPAASAKGRLVDEKSGKPLAKQTARYGVRVFPRDISQSGYTLEFGGTATTDDDGRFELKDLAAGAAYDISVMEASESGLFRVASTTSKGIFVFQSGETKDLGDIKHLLAGSQLIATPAQRPVAPAQPLNAQGTVTVRLDGDTSKMGEVNYVIGNPFSKDPSAYLLQTQANKVRLDWVEVTGKVVDEAQLPIPNARVRTAISGFQKQAETICDKKGEFSFQIPFGPWDGEHSGNLIVWTKDRQLQTMHYLPQVRRKDDARKSRYIPKMTVTLRPARAVGVKVNDANGKPVADATTVASGNFFYYDTVRTNGSGKATLLVPSNASVKRALAFKSGAGFDTADVSAQVNPYADDSEADGEIALTLRGAKTAVVRVVDERNRPAAGVEIVPTAFRGAGVPKVNVGLCPATHRFTNDKGEATFDWFPKEATGGQYRIEDDSDVTQLRATQGSIASGVDLTYVVSRPTVISGRVKNEDGTPAANVIVVVTPNKEIGASSAVASGAKMAIAQKTESDGSYSIRVGEVGTYYVVPDDEKFGAEGALVVAEDGKAATADFELSEATTVKGRVTVGPEKKPFAARLVYLTQFDKETKIDEVRRGLKPARVRKTMTDANGNYEFHVGPGGYDVFPELEIVLPSKSLTIADQKSVEANFEIPREERVKISGRVVEDGDENKPFAGAVVAWAESYWNPSAPSIVISSQKTRASEKGEFTLERAADLTVLQAALSAKGLAGAVVIDEKQEKATVPLRKAATVKGRLVSGADKAPLKRVGIYAVAVPDDPVYHREYLLFSQTMMNPAGKFEAPMLAPEVPVRVYYAVADKTGRERKWIPLPLRADETDKTLTKLKPGETLDLGDVELTEEQLAIDDAKHEQPSDSKKEAEKYAAKVPVGRYVQTSRPQQASGQGNYLFSSASPTPLSTDSGFTVTPQANAPYGPTSPATLGGTIQIYRGAKEDVVRMDDAVAAVPPSQDAGGTAESESVLVRGVVVEAGGIPSAKATVRAAVTDFSEKYETTCDNNGRFELVMPGGNWTSGSYGGLIVASADKTAQTFYQLPKTKRVVGDSKVVAADKVAYDLFVPIDSPLMMKPAREFSVRVLDGEGKPIQGAIAAATGNFFFYDSKKTDAEGRATLLGPSDAAVRKVWAFKSGAGCESADFPSADQGVNAEMSLVLRGARTVKIMAVDRNGKPIQGASFRPRLSGEQNNNIGFSWCPEACVKTDDKGVAVFDWLPKSSERDYFLASEDEGWGGNSVGANDASVTALRITLSKTMKVTGTAKLSDGSPAANAMVQVYGVYESGGYSSDGTRTDANGRYLVNWSSGDYGYVTVNAQQRGAAISNKFEPNKAGGKITVDVEIKSPGSVEGRVTFGPGNTPFANRAVMASQYVEKPKKDVLGRIVRYPPTVNVNVPTDADGNYKLQLSQGEYRIRPSYALETSEETVRIEAQESIRKDFHLPRNDRGTLKGKVIVGDDGSKPASGVEVAIYPQWWQPDQLKYYSDYKKAVTDSQGVFSLERTMRRWPIVAVDKASNRVGLTVLDDLQETLTISLRPGSTLKGRLMTGDGKKPVGKSQMLISIKIDKQEYAQDYRMFVGEIDEKGQFEIGGLPGGYPLHMEALVKKPDYMTWEQVAFSLKSDASRQNVTLEEGKTKDVGDVWTEDPQFYERMNAAANAEAMKNHEEAVKTQQEALREAAKRGFFERLAQALTGGLLRAEPRTIGAASAKSAIGVATMPQSLVGFGSPFETKLKMQELTGAVVDENGQPVANASVTAACDDMKTVTKRVNVQSVFVLGNAMAHCVYSQSAKTNSQGKFSLRIASESNVCAVLATADGGKKQAYAVWTKPMKDDKTPTLPASGLEIPLPKTKGKDIAELFKTPLRLELREAKRIAVRVRETMQNSSAKAPFRNGLILENGWLTATCDADSEGFAEFRIPAGVEADGAYSIASNQGSAYAKKPSSNGDVDLKFAASYDLKFYPDTHYRVRCLDKEENAVTGAQIIFSGFIDDEGRRFGTNVMQALTLEENGVAVAPATTFVPYAKPFFFAASRGGDFRPLTDDAAKPYRFASSSLRTPQGKDKLDGSAMELVFDSVMTITGTVVGEEGKPTAGATVCVMRPGMAIDEQNAWRREPQPEFVKTNKQGEFVYRSSECFRDYVLVVTELPNATLAAIGADDKKLGSTSAPVVLTNLTDDGVKGVKLKMQKKPVALAGVVAGPNGKPIEGQCVAISPVAASSSASSAKQETYWRVSKTDKEGRYGFYVAPGEYRIYLSNEDAETTVKLGDEDKRDANLKAAFPRRKVKGKVTRDGKPVERIDPNRPSVNLWIFEKDRFFANSAGMKTAPVDASGEFAVDLPARPIRFYSQELNGTRAAWIEIKPDQTEVEIELKPYVSAKAKLVDRAANEPMKNCKVRIEMAAEARFGWSGATETDENGQFSIHQACPGAKYKLTYQTASEETKTAYLQIPVDAKGIVDLGDLKVDDYKKSDKKPKDPAAEKIVAPQKDK